MMHFYAFKVLARAVVLPPAGLLILAIVGAALLASRHRRSGWSCLITGLAALWLLSLPVVADGLTRLTEVYPGFDPASRTDAQAIVILGAAVARYPAPEYPGRQPAASLELLERLDYGAWLSRTTHLPILVTADYGNAWAMALVLNRDFQVPTRWIEWKSRDTYENARNSAVMLRAANVKSILLVTSSPHMLRATREFRATGLQVTPAPVHVLTGARYGVLSFLPTADAMMDSNRAVYELIGERVRELMAALDLRRQPRS